jgi:hypothetical protein
MRKKARTLLADAEGALGLKAGALELNSDEKAAIRKVGAAFEKPKKRKRPAKPKAPASKPLEAPGVRVRNLTLHKLAVDIIAAGAVGGCPDRITLVIREVAPSGTIFSFHGPKGVN